MPEPASITPPPATRDPEIGELLQLMRVVDVERQQRDLALQELSADEQRKRLRAELEKVYAAEGAHVSPAEIDAAIDAHYADRFTFKPPARTLGYRLLWIYARRNRLALIVGVPLLCLALFAGAIVALAITAQREQERAAQSQVVLQVEQFSQAIQQVHTSWELASGKLTQRKVAAPAKNLEEINAHLRRTAETLRGPDAFARQYCPPGSTQPNVSLTTYTEAQSALVTQRPLLDDARLSLTAAESALTALDVLLAWGNSLDVLLGDIRQSAPPKLLLDQAERAHREGKAAFEQSDTDGAKVAVADLERVKKSLEQLKAIQAETWQLTTAIAAVAIEEAAKERAAKLAKAISAAVAVGDFETASGAITPLREVRNTLEETFTLRIVDRAGVKSGVARTVKEKLGAPNRQELQLYYLVVEAITPANKVLAKFIVNEETQQASRVTMWAERVPQELYEAVKAEKQKTGRVKDKILMTKERGYLTENPARLTKREAQITRWND